MICTYFVICIYVILWPYFYATLRPTSYLSTRPTQPVSPAALEQTARDDVVGLHLGAV
jgi:hypothetical protein